MNTHSFAELEVSEDTFTEIEKLLRAAGYDHAFIKSAFHGTVIDMHGIGLVKKQASIDPNKHLCLDAGFASIPIEVNGKSYEINHTEVGQRITYEAIRQIAFPHACPANPSCTFRYKKGSSAILSPNESAVLKANMIFNIYDTSNA